MKKPPAPLFFYSRTAAFQKRIPHAGRIRKMSQGEKDSADGFAPADRLRHSDQDGADTTQNGADQRKDVSRGHGFAGLGHLFYMFHALKLLEVVWNSTA